MNIEQLEKSLLSKELITTHELKTDPLYFQDVADQRKTFELRKNDRNFVVGDYLLLRETKHNAEEMKAGWPLEYTGREETRRISHIFPLPDGILAESMQTNMVILSFFTKYDYTEMLHRKPGQDHNERVQWSNQLARSD